MDDPASLLGIFLAGLLSATLLPGGSEAALIWGAGHLPAPPLALWTSATLGNGLGGFSGWLLGHWLARRDPGASLAHPRHRRAAAWLRRYGGPLLLFSWLPLLGDPLCVAAGWLRIGWRAAFAYIIIGKGLRYAALLWWLK